MSLETILPFLQPIAHLITDPGISEVMLNPDGAVFIERAGRLERVNETVAQVNVERAIKRIAHRADRDITEAEPLLEVRLPDGSRVSAICPPLTTAWCFTLRKFRDLRYSLGDLVSMKTITPGQRASLERAARDRRTILVSGGTSTGKTSMLNAIASVLPKEDRIILIEDIAEICIDTPNVVQMQARPARDGIRAVTIRDLVKQSLRFRPDRLIVGEVRGAEAFDLLQALNSGHAGSMSTIHATTAQSALNKLALYAMQAALDIPLRALGPSISEAVHLVVQMNRRNGQRIVDQILRVECYRRETDEYQFTDLTNED